jgi:exonuclease III
MANISRFVQWNCRSIKTKLIELKKIIHMFKPSVILLNETWLGPNERIQVRGYELFSCPRRRRSPNGKYYGGVAILVKHNLKIKDTLANYLAILFRWSLSAGYLPAAWKRWKILLSLFKFIKK